MCFRVCLQNGLRYFQHQSKTIAQLLVEDIVWIPEALLSDWALIFLMKDACKMLGIEKLNTTTIIFNVMEQWRG